MAAEDDLPEDQTKDEVENVREGLIDWPMGKTADDIQNVRYLLCVAAVPDAIQMPVERYLPRVVYNHLIDKYPKDKTNPDGTVKFVIKTGIDITEQTRAEEALRWWSPQKLFLNPDCGFGCFSSRCVNDESTAVAKLRSITTAARLLRDRHG